MQYNVFIINTANQHALRVAGFEDLVSAIKFCEHHSQGLQVTMEVWAKKECVHTANPS